MLSKFCSKLLNMGAKLLLDWKSCSQNDKNCLILLTQTPETAFMLALDSEHLQQKADTKTAKLLLNSALRMSYSAQKYKNTAKNWYLASKNWSTSPNSAFYKNKTEQFWFFQHKNWTKNSGLKSRNSKFKCSFSSQKSSFFLPVEQFFVTP